jgi:hypothetical protein
MELSIHISHNLPGRVRFRFSKPLLEIEKLKLHVMEHEGIQKMNYSDVTRGMLVHFNENVIDLQEILIRTALAFSLENHLKSVYITRKTERQFITSKGIVAGISIVASGLTTLLSPGSPFQKSLDWLSAITTSAAVLEHAGYDYRKKGSVDPEVFSLVFLANRAISGGNLLFPSALTWVATFGRHFSSNEGEGILLEIRKTGEKDQNYEVNVSKSAAKTGYVDLLNVFAEKFLSSETGFDNTIFEKSKTLLKSHKTNLEGIGEKVNRIILNFNQ